MAFAPEKRSELIHKPSASFRDPEGAQPVPPAVSGDGIEVALLDQLFKAFFQAARIGLQKAAEVLGGYVLQDPFPLQPEHQLQDLIPPVDVLERGVLIEIGGIFAGHSCL
jgi:hypothetical protein